MVGRADHQIRWPEAGAVGIVNNRCRHCGKVIFASRETADRCASRVRRELGQAKLRSYRGACGHWHLSSLKTLNELRAKLGLIAWGPQPRQEHRS